MPGVVRSWSGSTTRAEVYHHCPSDKWYGKTKQGEYMSEADAKANHGDCFHCEPLLWTLIVSG
jgi:hypothetical protein